MFDFWENDLTAEETQALLDKAFLEITRRRMRSPAILALEMHKPLSCVAAHGTLAAAPFLVPILGFDFVNDYSRLMSKRANIDRLIQMLEDDAYLPAKGEEVCAS